MTLALSLLLVSFASGGPQDAVWSSEYQLTDSAYDQYTDWSAGKNVAVGRDGTIHVVWTVEDYFLPVPFQVFYKRYTPGAGWSADTCISADEMALGRFSRYPSLVVDSAGNVHAVWMVGDSAVAKNCVVYKRCTPVGSGNDGWQAAVTQVSGYSTSDLKFTPDLACSPDGHVHVVWSRDAGSTNGIHYRESTDGGSNWQGEFAVFDTATSDADQVSPSIAVARNNTVHIAWCGHPYFGEAFHLYYRKRINTTWFAREGIVTSSADQYVPSIACSPLTNNPHIVWRRWYASNNYQIVYSYWDNTWQPVVSLADPSADTTQCNPQFTFSLDGSAHAVWRGWTGGASSLRQVRYAARSVAGVWTTPIDLTSATVRSRDYPSIATRGHDVHVVWQDDRGTYQNLYGRQGYVPFADVACTRLLLPAGTVDSGVVVTPACSVYNCDTAAVTYAVRLHIGSGYNQTATVTSHPGETVQYVEFPDWTAGARGTYAVRCSTELSTDGDRSNDRQTGSVTVEVHDAGVTDIYAPSGSVDSGAVINPQAEVRNYGTGPETFDVRFTISDGYSQTITRTMPAGGDSVFSFSAWTANTNGSFVTRCSTRLAGDLAPGNDTATGSVSVVVHDVGVTAIVAPTGNVDSIAMQVPQATVRNWGTSSEVLDISFGISDGYAQTITRTVAAHAESTFSFPDWWPAARGPLVARCSTQLAEDARPENDLATGAVNVVVHDVGVSEILVPGDSLDSGTVVYPKAVVRNLGTEPETFEIRFVIGGAYAESLQQYLSAGEVDSVEFNPWTAGPVGLLQMSCFSALAGDMLPANDTTHDSARVLPVTGIKASSDVPTRFALDAAPSPFSGAVALRASCPRVAGRGPTASLCLYDMAGELVRSFTVPAGATSSIRWDGTDARGRDAGAGVFYVRMAAGEATVTRRIVRLR